MTAEQKRELERCRWPGADPLYLAYHDEEWGTPLHDDRALFELLILEGAQAGLSWITVLRKREAYRNAFDKFEIAKVSRYTERKIEKLMANAGIIRNKAKLNAAVSNAKATLKVQKEFGSLDAYLWQFVNGKPIQNSWTDSVPARTAVSDALSKDLLARRFKFVGSTICYAFMQATGMVNDHLVTCFRHRQLKDGAAGNPNF